MPRSLPDQLKSFQDLDAWYRRRSADMLKSKEISERDYAERCKANGEINATLQFMVRNEDTIRSAVRAVRVDTAADDT